MSDKKMVRVRIAVAVSADGNWSASGWTNNGQVRNDDTLKSIAVEGIDEDDRNIVFHFVEADVPLPVSKTVEGTVMP